MGKTCSSEVWRTRMAVPGHVGIPGCALQRPSKLRISSLLGMTHGLAAGPEVLSRRAGWARQARDTAGYRPENFPAFRFAFLFCLLQNIQRLNRREVLSATGCLPQRPSAVSADDVISVGHVLQMNVCGGHVCV
eukprot:363852-Chlamydomonas_euryale.AAC.4